MTTSPALAGPIRILLPLFVALLLQACSAGVASPQGALPVIRACFLARGGSVPVELEVARTPEQRRKGLMGRSALAPNAGMLFQYRAPRSADHGFWMYQTLIPLDIAYLDQAGRIVSIRRMVPCASASGSGCPTYPAGEPFMQAVEMNAGFFREHGIERGDRLQTGQPNCPARQAPQ